MQVLFQPLGDIGRCDVSEDGGKSFAGAIAPRDYSHKCSVEGQGTATISAAGGTLVVMCTEHAGRNGDLIRIQLTGIKRTNFSEMLSFMCL